MSDDDQDDVPGFPWPMAIPAINWSLNGLACLGYSLYLGIWKVLFNAADAELYLSACVWLLWIAVLFLKAGSGIFFGHSQFFALANGHALFASIIGMALSALILNLRQSPLALFVFCHGFAMFAGCIIVFAYTPQWKAWAERKCDVD